MAAGETGVTGGAAAEARRLWHVLEPIHAVAYFAPECHDGYRALGLKGFWMGYFASRSAVFGSASPELVTATFFNFRPSMVARALPDAWSLASPADVLAARREGATAALARLLGSDAGPDGPAAPTPVAEAVELAEAAVAACDLAGRPLAAALAALPRPEAPLDRLWHAATVLREHRGDGHVAAALAGGLSGLDAHVTFAASGAVPRGDLQPHRGWTDDEWDGAVGGLVERGWLRSDGSPTEVGRARRAAIEATTDELAAGPWRALGPERTARLQALLTPLAARIVAGGGIPAVNPMGVPTA